MKRTIVIVALLCGFACSKPAEPVAAADTAPKPPTDAELQKRTTITMRAIAAAWEAYATNHNAYDAAGYQRYPVNDGAFTDPNLDIIFRDGMFIKYPEGVKPY